MPLEVILAQRRRAVIKSLNVHPFPRCHRLCGTQREHAIGTLYSKSDVTHSAYVLMKSSGTFLSDSPYRSTSGCLVYDTACTSLDSGALSYHWVAICDLLGG